MVTQKPNSMELNILSSAKGRRPPRLGQQTHTTDSSNRTAAGTDTSNEKKPELVRTPVKFSLAPMKATQSQSQNSVNKFDRAFDEPLMDEITADNLDDEETEKLVPTKTLGFQNSQFDLVRKFKENLRQNNYNNLRIFFIILCCEYVLQILLHWFLLAAAEGLTTSIKVRLTLQIGEVLVTGLVIVCTRAMFTSRGWVVYLFLSQVYPMANAVCAALGKTDNMYFYTRVLNLQTFFSLQVSIYSGILSFKQTCVSAALTFSILLAGNLYNYLGTDAMSVHEQDGHNPRAVSLHYTMLAGEILSFLVATLYCLVLTFSHLQSEISAFNNLNLGASTALKIRDFVDRLLPKHVRDLIASNSLLTGDSAEGVTILYADIVGFTLYSADKTPRQVVELLSSLFTSFDKESYKLNLYKVYTIGDCYVVMSFLDKNNRLPPEKECVDVVELAFKMIEIIARVRDEINFDGLHMRIGIHTGKIIGGVIGTGVIRYDLYGQDVLIANKMESSGAEDKIHISNSTKEMLEKSCKASQFMFLPAKTEVIESLKTSVPTYFLEKVDKAQGTDGTRAARCRPLPIVLDQSSIL